MIDTHVHVFNASDLQVSGYIGQAAAETMGGNECELDEFLSLVAPIAELLGRTFAPTGHDEVRALCELPTAHSRGQYLIDVKPWLAPARRLPIAEALAREFAKKPRIWDLYQRINGGRIRDLRLDAPAPSVLSPSAQEIVAALDRERIPSHGIQSFEARAPQRPRGLLDFIFANFRYRHENCLDYLDAYQAQGTPIDIVLASLVDFDIALGKGKTKTSVSEQIDAMSELVVAFGGRVLPFVAYNPWKDALSRTSRPALALVQDAIAKKGFVGVKLYPPMGFAVAGNAKQPASVQAQWPERNFGARLDDVLDEFFSYCIANNVPVMAHTSRSFPAHPAFSDLPGPAGWEQRLKKQGYGDLRVNFGHFGGDNYYANECKFWWAKGFVELMRAYDNTYADLAYFSHLLQRDNAGNLLAFLEKEIPANHRKLMFGTDWLMLLQEQGWDTYARVIESVVRTYTKNEPEGAANIMGLNAVHYLGLRQGDRNRERVLQFLRLRNVTEPPPWTKKVDRLVTTFARKPRAAPSRSDIGMLSLPPPPDCPTSPVKLPGCGS